MMKWLQWTPDRNGVVGVIFAAIIVVTMFAFLVMYFPDFQQRRRARDSDRTGNAPSSPRPIRFVSRSRAAEEIGRSAPDVAASVS
jgi:hypothetical protein